MDDQFPVTVAVSRADGSVEQVRVGTATRTAEGFSLRLGELSIGARADVRSAAPQARASSAGFAGGGAGGGGGDGMVFPPYGRSKGQPVVGATMQDLEFYANGSRRSLNDPAKSRWHDKEKVLLAAIEAEIARQSGGAPAASFGGEGDEPPPHGDDDLPF